MVANMELLMDDRYVLDDRSFAELVVWRRADGSFKYRLAYVVDEVCVLRYDNETGKGDHRHMGRRETAYFFTTVEQLLADFWTDVAEKRDEDCHL
jgi:hypothetical protein